MKAKQEKLIFVGVDLHKEHHTAVTIDCWNQKLGEIQFDNRPSAFPELVKAVKKLTKRGMTPVYGLEDVGGFGRALAVYLKENGHVVKEVNPKYSSGKRKNRPTTLKNDSWDAECVARVLRDELNILPDANPLDRYWAIGQLVKLRNGIGRHYTGNVRRLHQQISYHYPSYKRFFSEIDGKTALAFWSKYPSPHHLNEETETTLAEFLKKESNHFLSLAKARQILGHIEADGDTRREFQEQRDFIIQGLVRSIKFDMEEMSKLEAELVGLVNGIGCKLDSMPGIDLVTAASFLGEIGDIDRFESADKLARFAGIAPIVCGSGNKLKGYKSKQGNRELHELFRQLAIRQLVVAKHTKQPRNAYMLAYYKQKVDAGKTNRQAIVCLMRKLVNVIYHMLKNKTEYTMPKIPEAQAG